MEIRSLRDVSMDTLFKAFEQAFANYDYQISKTQLQAMLRRRGYNPELSFAAFQGDEIMSFTLNGTGRFKQKLTAYDTGTGTLEKYRGLGLATRIFEYSIPYLKEKGIEQYLLEVLQHNTNAVSVYRKIGFKITREFNYFFQENKNVRDDSKPSAVSCEIRPIRNFDLIPYFDDFLPSWQNSSESISRAADGFICLGAFVEGRITGYCILEPVSGDLTRLAVHKPYRRKGIASLLLREIINLNQHDSIKILNTDIACDSITGFLKAKGIEPTGKQFEMMLDI